MTYRLEDSNRQRKIRIAKCKKRNEFPSTDKFKWWNIDPIHVKNLSQVNKINFKRKEEFEAFTQKFLKNLEKLMKIDQKLMELNDKFFEIFYSFPKCNFSNICNSSNFFLSSPFIAGS